jgi:TonB family protein
MTSRADCARAEMLAGAIAIGEAGEAERDRYRAHLAVCEACLHELGGEREVERVMTVAAQAREDERWEPDLRKALVRARAPRNAWRWGAALAAAVIAVVVIRAEHPRAVTPAHHSISAQEARALAALNTQSAPRREGRAESLVLGGRSTFSATLEMSVDERGVPVQCRITKSSGSSALDQSVCRAAMHARYPPRRANGR